MCRHGTGSDTLVDVSDPLDAPTSRGGLRGILNRLIANPRFQDWSARIPIVSRRARADGEALFDVVAGFLNAQVLAGLVELDIFETLLEGPRRAETLARGRNVSAARLEKLLRAGVALDLLRLRRDGQFELARKGAALIGVPGLQSMIRHHGALYRDMEDPVALLRGERETELAKVWPYVFGEGGAADPSIKRFYSDLMADSQAMVAADTMRMVDLRDATHILDVGGGSGAFALAVAQRLNGPRFTVFDLPGVAEQALSKFDASGLKDRLEIASGSFLDGTLPRGADVFTLIRVLYDHEDRTVRHLLTSCYDALPAGGRLVISEPMTGGDTPTRAGDVYFSFYCMAMQTGTARSSAEISVLLEQAGFTNIRVPRAPRPFVTSAVVAEKAR